MTDHQEGGGEDWFEPLDPFGDGSVVEAVYSEQSVQHYRGNPLLEALPPLLERADARAAMAHYPEYLDQHRLLEPMVREHMTGLIETIRHPVGLHGDLYSRVSRLIRNGYVSRNPAEPSFQRRIEARVATLAVHGTGKDLHVTGGYDQDDGIPGHASGMTFLGTTGMGKTATIRMCLKLYPKLIIHREYRGKPFVRTQMPRLRMSAPSDGSIHTLTSRFFVAVDSAHAGIGAPTNYAGLYQARRSNIQQIIHGMARVACHHGLGLLILDEIQDLNPRGSRAVLSFVVELVNTVGVPVVLIGGVDAISLLSAQFRQARRGATEGDIMLTRSQNGAEWRAFCEVIWRYQYTRNAAPLTSAIVNALYRESQGITHYLSLAHKLAQVRAIALDEDAVTPAIIHSIRDSLTQAAPVMRALAGNAKSVIKARGDVDPPEGYPSVPFLRADRVTPGDAWGDVVSARSDAGDVPQRADVRPSPSGPDIGTPIQAPDRDYVPEPAATLFALAKAARAEGKGAHGMLVALGVAGDPLWARLSLPAASERPATADPGAGDVPSAA